MQYLAQMVQELQENYGGNGVRYLHIVVPDLDILVVPRVHSIGQARVIQVMAQVTQALQIWVIVLS